MPAARRCCEAFRSDQAQGTAGDLEAVEARAGAVCRTPEAGRGQTLSRTAGSVHGPWRLANSPALAKALPNAYFDSLGIPR
jgi:hypothetical protein